MKILPKDCLPLSEAFSVAILKDVEQKTSTIVLIRSGRNIPITGMLQCGDVRTVYGTDGTQYRVGPNDDIGIIE